MDGLNYLPTTERTALSVPGTWQRSLKAPIACAGVALHSGEQVAVRLVPAPVDHGVKFRRVDRDVTVAARFDNVVDTRLCTVIADAAHPEARVGTIEHLMAALAATGVDNLLVEVDGAELPVLDGSAEPWMFLLDCAGIAVQDAPRRTIEVLRVVRVDDGDAFVELRPGSGGLDLALSIQFDSGAIGQQAMTIRLEANTFRRELSRSRTFAHKHEIDQLQQAGLARGGSLDNAVVVDGESVLNPAGLRMPQEFVRHKLLDAVGDLALAGGALQGRFVGHKSGHRLNNRLLHALFADPANWRFATDVEQTLIAA